MNFNSSDISEISGLWWFPLHKANRQRGAATASVSTDWYFLAINDKSCSNSTRDFLSNPSPTTSSAFASAMQDYGIIESLLVSVQKIPFTLADSRSLQGEFFKYFQDGSRFPEILSLYYVLINLWPARWCQHWTGQRQIRWERTDGNVLFFVWHHLKSHISPFFPPMNLFLLPFLLPLKICGFPVRGLTGKRTWTAVLILLTSFLSQWKSWTCVFPWRVGSTLDVSSH